MLRNIAANTNNELIDSNDASAVPVEVPPPLPSN